MGIGLIWLLALVDQYLFCPLFRLLTTKVLFACGYQLDSWLNLLVICQQKPLLALALLLEILVLCLLFEIELLLTVALLTRQRLQFRWSYLTPLAFLENLLFLLVTTAILPLLFRLPLFSELPLADFLWEHLTHIITLGLTILLYLILLYLATRSLGFWSNLISGQSSWSALKNSWRQQHRQVIGSWLQAALALAILVGLTLGLQALFTYCLKAVAGLTALILMTCYQLGVSTIYCWALTQTILLDHPADLKVKARLGAVLLGLSLILTLGLQLPQNHYYLFAGSLKTPVVISHRGSSQDRGLPNSLQSFYLTSRLHPNFIEIDLHETKDKQFVVFHDEKLKFKGRWRQPRQLTLRQLTGLTLHDQKNRAQLVAFDRYLQAAQAKKQRLLIEVKTTPADSRQMAKLFNQKYGRQLLKNGDQVQSLDYHFLSQLQQLNPRLPLIQLESFNLANPDLKRTGYALEYSSNSMTLVRQVHEQAGLVYLWTINNQQAMQRALYQHADGLITDNVPLAQRTLRTFRRSHSYLGSLISYCSPCF